MCRSSDKRVALINIFYFAALIATKAMKAKRSNESRWMMSDETAQALKRKCEAISEQGKSIVVER